MQCTRFSHFVLFFFHFIFHLSYCLLFVCLFFSLFYYTRFFPFYFLLSIQTWTQPVSHKPILKSNTYMMVTILMCFSINFVNTPKSQTHTKSHLFLFFVSFVVGFYHLVAFLRDTYRRCSERNTWSVQWWNCWKWYLFLFVYFHSFFFSHFPKLLILV